MDANSEIGERKLIPVPTDPIPAFAAAPAVPHDQLRRAVESWLGRTPSLHTRLAYRRDLEQFITHVGLPTESWHKLPKILPGQVIAWRDSLPAGGQTNSTVRRKLTTLRSLFSYLQVYGYTGANPAHGKFVAAPSVPRDGKTVALSPDDCRRLLDAPRIAMDAKLQRQAMPEERPAKIVLPAGVRDRALLAVLAYSGCRVGELVRLRVRDFKTTGEHRILAIIGKGGKERITPLHPEAVERLAYWLEVSGLRDEPAAPLFPAARSSRGRGLDGFRGRPMTTRAVEKLIDRYVALLRLDPNVTVHSLRVTALTTARERGSDIIDLQEYAGHADPRTTLTYIRSRDRLSKSPAYVLRY